MATFGLGWQVPAGASIGLAVVAVLLGTLAFAGIGLLLAGLLRAETMLAVANVLFVASLALGGIVVPIDHLPAPLAAIAGALPAAAAVRRAAGRARRRRLRRRTRRGPFALLAIWGVAAVVLAARTFRWE